MALEEIQKFIKKNAMILTIVSITFVGLYLFNNGSILSKEIPEFFTYLILAVPIIVCNMLTKEVQSLENNMAYYDSQLKEMQEKVIQQQNNQPQPLPINQQPQKQPSQDELFDFDNEPFPVPKRG
jgi:hypothetical protein